MWVWRFIDERRGMIIMRLCNKSIFLHVNWINSKFRNTLICSTAALLLGCGTINTAVRGDSVARSNLSHVKSPCETIPRIYSGVSYDICALRGKPSRAALWMGAAPELILVDLALSGVLDTVALPYTVYGQINEGHINLK